MARITSVQQFVQIDLSILTKAFLPESFSLRMIEGVIADPPLSPSAAG